MQYVNCASILKEITTTAGPWSTSDALPAFSQPPHLPHAEEMADEVTPRWIEPREPGCSGDGLGSDQGDPEAVAVLERERGIRLREFLP